MIIFNYQNKLDNINIINYLTGGKSLGLRGFAPPVISSSSFVIANTIIT
jgi:hypothetical protein